MSSVDASREGFGDYSSPGGGAGPQPTPVPRLRRTRGDRVVFGVAGGLGRYLGVDPVLVRIGFVLLTVFGGSGVLLYLIGLIAIPEEAEGEEAYAAPAGGWAGSNVAVILGAVLVLVGSLTLVGRLLPGLDHLVGPALLIAAGALVIGLGGRR